MYPEINSFKEYAKQARITATYVFDDTTAISGAMYSSLGLANEVGEFFDSIEMLDSSAKSLLHFYNEGGDVLWYIFNLLQDFNIDIVQKTYTKDNLSIEFHKEQIHNNISKICGIVKKQYRDREHTETDAFPIILSDKLHRKMESMLYDIVYSVGHVLLLAFNNNTNINSHINRAMSCNIKKLSSRQERGVLNGSGDDR